MKAHKLGVGDNDLAPLAGMPKLKSLFVSSQFNGRLTDAGLKHLVHIQTLESLKLAEYVVTSEGDQNNRSGQARRHGGSGTSEV